MCFSPASSWVQISFWLIENGYTVLIAACDTFRAGAVEQLRTHQRRLSSLHPPQEHGGRPVVQLYEKGYGKDAAGIAMEAIAYGNYRRSPFSLDMTNKCTLSRRIVLFQGRNRMNRISHDRISFPQLVTRSLTWYWWTPLAACRITAR